MNLNTIKGMGTVYEVEETETIKTKNGTMDKRSIYIEMPTQLGDRGNSEVLKFETINEDCGSLDWFKAGMWVNVIYRITGRFWVRPKDNLRMHFTSLKLVDIKEGKNPHITGEKVDDSPDDLVPDPVAKLANNVKDWINDKGTNDVNSDPGLWSQDKGTEEDGLPF